MKVSPLQLHKVTLEPSAQTVGVFGCALAAPITVTELLKQSGEVATRFNITLQLADASYVAGASHLVVATMHALRAFQRGTKRADVLGTEILRFAAAQRQITRALVLMGIKDETRNLGGVVVGASPKALGDAYQEFLTRTGAKDAPAVLELTTPAKAAAIQGLFEISSTELEATATSRRQKDRYQALTRLVYERCALLGTSR